MCNHCHSLVDFAVSGCGKTWSETTEKGFTFQCLVWNDIRAIIQHVILWQIICNNTKSGIMKTGIIRIQP